MTSGPAHPVPAPTQGWEETDGASMSGRSSCSQREINVNDRQMCVEAAFPLTG